MSIEVFIAILILAVFISLVVRHKRVKLVESKSDVVARLLETNSRYTFHTIKKHYKYHEKHEKKPKYDRDSSEKFLNRHIFENTHIYDELIRNIYDNRDKYDNYLLEYDNIKSLIGTTTLNVDVKLKADKFYKYEGKIVKKTKLREPITNVTCEYILSYTSPKGRNRYSKHCSFSELEIENELNKVRIDIENKKSRQYVIKRERSKMTDSFRYDIMRHDGFMCVLCGSTVKDGVKLHVDHIVPVSKGGKTEKSNLRTLCDRCNLGKKDKIE